MLLRRTLTVGRLLVALPASRDLRRGILVLLTLPHCSEAAGSVRIPGLPLTNSTGCGIDGNV